MYNNMSKVPLLSKACTAEELREIRMKESKYEDGGHGKEWRETVMRNTNKKRKNGGFSLVELIIVIAIMAVLVGILAPQYLSYMHKAKVAADWANIRNYYTEITLDYISTGQYNPNVPTLDGDDPATMKLTEIHFLSGETVTLKAGYFHVTKDNPQKGYNIAYNCNECLTDWEKHKDTCHLVLK